MPFPLDPARIALALAVPVLHVERYWPPILECLESLAIAGRNSCVGVLATIRVECPPFEPIHEYGSAAYLSRKYDGRTDLGDVHAGDGVKYAGRGFVQITGRLNYEHYGQLLGIHLVDNPDEALEPNCAAAILAAYWHERGIDRLAERQDWVAVRRAVNGGVNGLPEFLQYIEALVRELAAVDLAAQTSQGASA